MKLTGSLYFAGLCVVSLLTACGGGGGSSPVTAQPASENIQILGAGIKGPLAFADAKIYLLDPSFPEFYDPDSPISSAMTNASAQITGLSVPATTQPPYVLTIGGNLAIDLNTGKAPVISTLVTVITSDMLKANRPIYTTPLTTLAYHMARYNTGSKSFESKLKDAAPQITSLFSIDPAVAIDIFSSPLIIDASTVTVAEQEEAVYHRAALEAFAAKAYALSFLPENASADIVIDRLARDLQSDGVIDNAANGTTIGGIDTVIVNQDPMEMTIPNTAYQVNDIITLMSEERILLGTDFESQFLVNNITLPATNPVVVEPAPEAPAAEPTQPTTLPFDLRNTSPEQASLSISVSKPADVDTATITFGAFDADHSNEGELIINGNTPVPLFGAQGVSANNSVSAQISINTPASYWNNGNNVLVFRHTSSGGFVIEDLAVTFQNSISTVSEPILALTTDRVDFGIQDIGGISDAVTVSLSNIGTVPFSVSSISVSTEFTENNNCSNFIPIGSSCTVSVNFVPMTEGALSGALVISDSSVVYTVSLSGTGNKSAAPAPTVSPSSGTVLNVDFDSHPGGHTPNRMRCRTLMRMRVPKGSC